MLPLFNHVSLGMGSEANRWSDCWAPTGFSVGMDHHAPAHDTPPMFSVYNWVKPPEQRMQAPPREHPHHHRLANHDCNHCVIDRARKLD